MDKSVEILSNIVSFLVVAIIFLMAIAIIFRLTLKHYNVKSNKLKFYGLFLEMDNSSIIAFSAVSLNYIFLIYFLFFPSSSSNSMNPSSLGGEIFEG